MKKITILYWVCTGLFALSMLASAIPSIMSSPASYDLITAKLGYPRYFVPFTGVAKLLGVFAIHIPGFPTIKEWAYAGLVFDLAGATYSAIAIGESPANWLWMSIWFVLFALSYYYYRRKLHSSSVIP